MPAFQYKAKEKTAETVSGEIIAENKEDAVEKIIQMGLTPVSVDDPGQAVQQNGFGNPNKVRTKELYLFSRQLGNLLKAGIPILRALEIISEQIHKPYFRNIVQSIHSGIRNGLSFSNCLAEYPHIFSSLYISMVKVGEESGKLKETIFDMAEYLHRQDEISSKVRTAVAYPILMVIFGIGTIIFVLTFVMPQITGLFINLKQDLPAPTILVMKLSEFLMNWWTWIALVLVLLMGAKKTGERSAAGRKWQSQFLLGLPLAGEFFLKIELARFCRTFGLSIKSGLSVVRALQLSIPLVSNELIREQLTTCQDELLAGRSFGDGLKSARRMPVIMGHLIAVGEETGSLCQTLQDIADNFEQETNELIKIMTTLLEPLMIIVVGSVVGFIVIAMLLPIFQLDIFAR